MCSAIRILFASPGRTFARTFQVSKEVKIDSLPSLRRPPKNREQDFQEAVASLGGMRVDGGHRRGGGIVASRLFNATLYYRIRQSIRTASPSTSHRAEAELRMRSRSLSTAAR